MVSSVVTRVKGILLRMALALPASVQRLLAGRAVVIDGQRLHTETQLSLRLQRLIREKGAEELPVDEGRALIRRHTKLTGGRQPIGETRDLTVPSEDGSIPSRLYVPRSGVRGPLLVYIHGGGMVFGDLESHDPLCRFLAERADVRVLSLEYRLAPEHPYPAALEDCVAAYRWVVQNADGLGADPKRIAVGGDSAGGYLSAVVALKAAEEGLPLRFQMLVYPVTDMAGDTESRRLFDKGFYLTDEFIALADRCYIPEGVDRRAPLVSVLHTPVFPAGLAPALVVTAGFDPLRDEGEAYARLLADHGVAAELKRYPGMIHGFVNVIGVGRANRAAVAEIAVKLKAALA